MILLTELQARAAAIKASKEIETDRSTPIWSRSRSPARARNIELSIHRGYRRSVRLVAINRNSWSRSSGARSCLIVSVKNTVKTPLLSEPYFWPGRRANAKTPDVLPGERLHTNSALSLVGGRRGAAETQPPQCPGCLLPATLCLASA